MLRPRSTWHSLLLALTAVYGCGSQPKIQGVQSSSPHQGDATKQSTATDDGNQAVVPDAVKPPREYYDALVAESMQLLDTQGTTASGQPVLWVNFDGAVVTKGYARGQSFIPCQATSTIPSASDLSSADRDAIVQMVQQYYDATGAHLDVTQQKPTAGDFTTMNVGGSYSDLGCVGSGVLGIAPLDDGNANPNDIGFAFSKGVGDNTTIAQTIAHEAGHSFGLDHVTNKTDLMYPSEQPNITGFGVGTIVGSGQTQDEPALLRQALVAGGNTSTTPVANNNGQSGIPAGGSTPAAGGGAGGIGGGMAGAIPGLANLPAGLGGLPGLGQIGSIGQLLPGLTPGNILNITSLLPQIQNLLPIGAAAGGLPGLDKIFTVIGLASSAGGAGGAGAAGGIAGAAAGAATGGLANIFNGGLASSILGGKGGPLSLGGLAQSGGFGGLGSAVAALQGLLGGVAGGGGANLTNPTSLPDFAGLLGLGKLGAGGGAGIASLLGSMNGSAKVVNNNFHGADAQALISMLKVAYGQQYGSMIGGLVP